MPNIKRYYPPLSDIFEITLFDDPNHKLHFLYQTLFANANSLFSKLFYKDFQFSKSAAGDSGSYSLKLVSNKRLEFDVFGSGVSIIINRDSIDANISSFPLALDYEWKVLRLVKAFDSNTASGTALEVLDILIEILQLDDNKLIATAINVYTSYDPTKDAIEQIEDQLQSIGYTGSVHSSTTTDPIVDIIGNIEGISNGYTTIQAIYDKFIDHTDLDEQWKNLNNFFKHLINKDVKEYALDFITPKARVRFDLIGHVGVPRKWLLPMEEIGGKWVVKQETTTGEPRAELEFIKAICYLDTQTGAGLDIDFSISTNDRVQLGKTGLQLELDTLKIDLRDDKNIPEADNDGRPATFNGVYIKKATVHLPGNWEDNQTGPNTQTKIVARNLIIGNEGGVSGIISAVSGPDDDHLPKELYVTFEVGPTSNIIIDNHEGTVEIKELNWTATNGKGIKKFGYKEGEEIFIRDNSTSNYYKIDTSGTVTSETRPSPGILRYKFANNMEISLDSFYLELHQNRVISSSVIGTLSGGKLENPVRITLDFDNGFIIKAFVPNKQAIIDNEKIKIELDGLEFGKNDGKWQFGIAGKATIKKAPPVVDKFLPYYFDVNRLFFKEGNPLEFDLETGWRNGTIVRGDDKGGVTGYLPLNLNVIPGFSLDGIRFKAKSNPNGEIEALLEGAAFNLGPIAARVDGFGAKLEVIEETNEALADFGGTKTVISMVGPKGIYLEINAGVVSGKGYLYLGDGEYIGALNLKIELSEKFTIDVTAIGIITTKMPDGGKGTAVLTIISVKFSKGIPLIWGFTLNGLGGMLGIHHTMDALALRSGVKAGILDSILFPEIKVDNIGKIVNDLKTVFPIQRDQFLIGLMAKIKWKSILTIDFGLMVEFSNPVRLAIIGKLGLKAGKSDQASSFVKVNVAFIGIIDFDKKYMSFDASIYDSQITFVTLYGDMAVRLFWGEHKEFLISIGGFHPAYDVPSYLLLPAKMDRITISLIDEKLKELGYMKLILEVYLALTTNTLQFGAKLSLAIVLGKKDQFQLLGEFGFDVLFQFKPFKFMARVYAMLALLYKKKEILAIGMDMNLVGPGPWHADGSAYFKVLGLKKTVKFDKTWGNQTQISSKPPISIEELIDAELKDLDNEKGNWTAQLPDNRSTHVQYKEIEVGNNVIMDPLGSLSITQRAAPLGVKLEKNGLDDLSDPGIYSIEEVVINSGSGSPVTINSSNELFKDTKEDFAPSQFKNMEDHQKLSAKSFEYHKAGVQVKSDELEAAGYVDREVEYDLVIVDDENGEPDRTNTAIAFPIEMMNNMVQGGLISSNPVSINQNGSLAQSAVSVKQEGIKLKANDTLEEITGVSELSSYAEALDKQEEMQLNNLAELVPA